MKVKIMETRQGMDGSGRKNRRFYGEIQEDVICKGILKKIREKIFQTRLEKHFPRLLSQYIELYGNRYDALIYLESLVSSMQDMWKQRPEALKALDEERSSHWFSEKPMIGAVCYVDLFSGTLKNLEKRIPYLIDLGVNYLHLMPLFATPEGEHDGGYAIKNYRAVHPSLGDMQDLKNLAEKLRSQGISLVLDFVLNHTADQHAWAIQAKAGHSEYRDFYFIFEREEDRDQYAPYLRDIFPTHRKGSFTFVPEAKAWVWTTFNSFQWDLNYQNPAVFEAMAKEMLFIANAGAEVLRFDALAFTWKEKYSGCENLEQAHTLIRLFRTVMDICAPSLLFKSEAIVHPDEVVKYIDIQECNLSYNPTLMAGLWEALATRKTELLQRSLRHRIPQIPDTAWVNYVRCHDDIGWTFADDDAWSLGINPQDHRKFLNNFYTGKFPGSFARGVPFQEDPETGDARVSGSCASLAGLEKALKIRGKG
jgi:amylosucrase